jgi:hypothetical protein
MSTSKRTVTAALEAGDLQAAVAALRQDVVFHSPILATVGDEVRGLPTVITGSRVGGGYRRVDTRGTENGFP